MVTWSSSQPESFPGFLHTQWNSQNDWKETQNRPGDQGCTSSTASLPWKEPAAPCWQCLMKRNRNRLRRLSQKIITAKHWLLPIRNPFQDQSERLTSCKLGSKNGLQKHGHLIHRNVLQRCLQQFLCIAHTAVMYYTTTQPPRQGHAFLCTTSHHTCHLQMRVGIEELLCYLLLLN